MKIAQVSKKYDITPDTLRYYERVGLLPNVKKNSSGIRDYSEEDCGWVEFIKCMRGAGLSIEVLNKYITLYCIGEETHQERKELLIEQRDILAQKMDAMKETLEKLDYKIEKYDVLFVGKKKDELCSK